MKRVVVFRLDDLCPTMNSKNFIRVRQIFNKYKIKPLIGIVPENKDEKLKVENPASDFWNLMKALEKEGWSIAMHGVHHLYDSSHIGMVSVRKKSEFSGHSYDVQYKKICYGKRILNIHHINTEIFFAPGHSYDMNTVKALYDNGFRIISDGRSRYCYEMGGMKFIPCRKYEYDRKSKGVITICLHINAYSEQDFDYLEKFIIANRNYVVSYAETLGIKNKNKFLMRLDERLYVLYERYIRYFVSPYYQKTRQVLKLKK